MGNLTVELHLSEGIRLGSPDRLVALLQFAGQREGATGEIGLWICRDEEIACLHEQYQAIPGPTDVLSFPGDSPYLGDIAVSAETAARQAVEAGHSSNREIAFLALHGLLHLVGYDDRDEASRSRMLARQEELLRDFEEESPGDWE
jgi:probable rRNA maturation factor